MQQSLKTFIHMTLAPILGRAPITLYQRQAPMVFAGLLDVVEGRGPGSGVAATPHSVAMLLVALLATDTPSDVAAATEFAKLKPRGGKCELTGETTLVAALEAILKMEKLPLEVWLQAERGRSQVIITYSDADADEGFSQSAFTKGGKLPPQVTGLHASVALFKGLHAISKALKG